MRPTKRQYSILACALIGTSQVTKAQVQHTDIDPDFVIDDIDDNLFLDIDNNGNVDFLMGIGHVSFFTYGWGSYYHIAGPSIFWTGQPNHAVVGQSNLNDFAWFGAAYNLYENDYIGTDRNFLDTLFGAFICAREYYELNDDSISDQGEYSGFWQDVQTDRFLGIRFQDGLDRTHYGWIRCDAPDSGRVLVVKDYAYETQPGVGILAGNMGEPVLIQEAEQLLFSLYPNPAQEWIEIRFYENEQLIADIRNIDGKMVSSHLVIPGTANRFPVEGLPSGTYFAILRNETGEIKGKQVWVKQ